MAVTLPPDIGERLGIPEALQKHVAPDAATRTKIAVARGLLPAPAKTLLSMQFVLLGDPDATVRAEAEAALVAMPGDRAAGLIDASTHPNLLEFFAYRRTGDDLLMERVALLRQINDKSICYLAEKGSERIGELISQNQERLLVTPQILRFLRRNPLLPASTIERCVSFLRLYGIDVSAVSEDERLRSEEALAQARAAVEAAGALEQQRQRGTATPGTPRTPSPGQGPGAPPGPRPVPHLDPGAFVRGPLPFALRSGEVFIPPPLSAPFAPVPGLWNPLAGLLADWGIADQPDFLDAPYGVGAADDVVGPPIHSSPFELLAPDVTGAVELGAKSAAKRSVTVDLTGLSSLAGSDFAFGFDEDNDDFDAMLTRDSDVEPSDAMRGNIAKAIGALAVGDKIKLAYKGNKAVREYLIRDTNKLVACAVVKSGRITDNEALAIATNRAVHEEVIREMSRNKEYLRKYPVKVALCGNPKTPISVTMSLLNGLHVKDLQHLARNRNVSSAVFSAADKLFKNKRSERGG